MASVQRIFSQLFEGLSPRQREVILGRYGLGGSGEPETLAALGERYGITRERIRQIEASALGILKRRIGGTPACSEILTFIGKHLRNSGGVSKSAVLLEGVTSLFEGVTDNHLELILGATGAFFFYPEDKDLWPFYYSDKASLKEASDFISQFVKFLRGRKNDVLVGEYNVHLGRFIKQEKVTPKLAQNYLSISKKIYVNPFGDIGLTEWPEIKPKTIRDRIYVVLKKRGEPLHFRTIADLINKTGFAGREALAPTVHNELIKDERFVLVGRGIYGLAERGYQPGTAKEVIQRILKSNGPLDFDKLVATVQRERFFKPNTILANLQKRDLFERLSNGMYRVRET